MLKKLTPYILSIVIIAVILIGVAIINYGDQTPVVSAQVSGATRLAGYAWSDNIGWISFNTDTPVTKDSSNNLVGYAWSDNIGWIKFGGLTESAMPNGSGTYGHNAVIDGVNIKGWARACAGTVNGDCTGGSRDDGWDGWLSLGGNNYGIKLTTVSGKTMVDTVDKYAWGSDVVGWVDFNPFNYSGAIACIPNINNDNCGVVISTVDQCCLDGLCKKIGESGVFYNDQVCANAATSTRVCQANGTFNGDINYRYSNCGAGLLTNLSVNPVDLKAKKTGAVLNPIDGPLSVKKNDLVTVKWAIDVKTSDPTKTTCTKTGDWSGVLTGLVTGINEGVIDIQDPVQVSKTYKLTCDMTGFGTYSDTVKVNVTNIVEF